MFCVTELYNDEPAAVVTEHIEQELAPTRVVSHVALYHGIDSRPPLHAAEVSEAVEQQSVACA